MDYIVNKNGIQVMIEADPVAIKKQVVEQYKEMRKEKRLSQEQVDTAAEMARTYPVLKVDDIILLWNYIMKLKRCKCGI